MAPPHTDLQPDLERCDLTGLRAVVVSQPTTHGVAGAVGNQLRSAVAAGASVTLVSPDEGPLVAAAIDAGVDYVRLDLERSASWRDLLCTVRLRSLLRDADLVHLHSSKAGADGRLALASVTQRPPIVFSPHGWSWLVGGRLGPAYRSFERCAVRWSDAVVAVSSEERAEGIAVLGPRAGTKIRVIENGVDTTAFTPSGEVATRSEAPLLVCVGRLTEAKGQVDLIEALALSRHRDAHAVFAGSGPDLAMLTAAATEFGVRDRIEFLGEVRDPGPLLRAADVVVVPSRWDGMSLALLEAMACGAAIVATRVSGSSAVASCGSLVPVSDPDALARSVDDLLDDPARRAEMGAAARATAILRYDARRSAAATLRLWKELAS